GRARPGAVRVPRRARSAGRDRVRHDRRDQLLQRQRLPGRRWDRLAGDVGQRRAGRDHGDPLRDLGRGRPPVRRAGVARRLALVPRRGLPRRQHSLMALRFEMLEIKSIPTTTLLSCALLLGASACNDSGSDSDQSGSETGDEGDGDGDGDHEQAEVVDCMTELEPPAAGSVCTAEGQAGGSLLIRGDVLTPETAHLGGRVVVEGGGITCAGCDCAAESAFDATITCADAVITPGLINTHDHITYAHNWPIGDGPDRYEHRHDWREGQNGHAPLPYQGNAPAEAVVAAELRFVMSGATSTASAGGRWGLLRNVDTTDNGGLPLQPVGSDTFPL